MLLLLRLISYEVQYDHHHQKTNSRDKGPKQKSEEIVAISQSVPTHRPIIDRDNGEQRAMSLDHREVHMVPAVAFRGQRAKNAGIIPVELIGFDLGANRAS